MKQLRALFVLLLLLATAAGVLFGIQTLLALPKMAMSAIAVLLMLAAAAIASPLLEESTRVENDGPKQGFS